MISLQGGYEVKCHTLEILREQKFKITKQDLMIAKDMIRKYESSNLNAEDQRLFVKTLLRRIARIEKEIREIITSRRP